MITNMYVYIEVDLGTIVVHHTGVIITIIVVIAAIVCNNFLRASNTALIPTRDIGMALSG